jgi:hypothetical protein
MCRGKGIKGKGRVDVIMKLLNVHDDSVVDNRSCERSSTESCSWVKMGQRLLGFARAKSLFPPLW